jgi:hypothetical protein
MRRDGRQDRAAVLSDRQRRPCGRERCDLRLPLPLLPCLVLRSHLQSSATATDPADYLCCCRQGRAAANGAKVAEQSAGCAVTCCVRSCSSESTQAAAAGADLFGRQTSGQLSASAFVLLGRFALGIDVHLPAAVRGVLAIQRPRRRRSQLRFARLEPLQAAG